MKKKDIAGTVIMGLVGIGTSFAGEILLSLFAEKIAGKIRKRCIPGKQEDMLVGSLTVAEFKELLKGDGA